MTTKQATTIAQIIVAIGLISYALWWMDSESVNREYVFKLAIGLGIAIAISIVVWCITNFRLMKYFVLTNIPFLRKKSIRITVAYLFRIELDGKYLLVKNKRNVPGYQPVGGVYKFLRRENAKFFDEIGLVPDTKIERDEIAEDDLRMKLKKRYKLLRFIRWFKRKENREIDPWREFYEELVATGILSHENFPHIQYRFIRQHAQLKYSKHHETMEYKVADIFELQFANEAQKNEIRQLMKDVNKEVLVATSEEINNKKSGDSLITEHTYKII